MNNSRLRSIVCSLGLAASAFAVRAAQIDVTPQGTPAYKHAIDVPPGAGGLEPTLSLDHTASSINGIVGYGWSLRGPSLITRCEATIAVDGAPAGVKWSANDKLCLDGERLIMVSGNAGLDAFGWSGSTQFTEFRTETDAYSRIRAYGLAGSANANSGPVYFRVWTKDGRVIDYGNNPKTSDNNTNANILPPTSSNVGYPFVQAWAVSRIADIFGNHIDFKYQQQDRPWGSVGGYQVGHEWWLAEIQYSNNKVIFGYEDRPTTSPQDASEAYNYGVKNLSIKRLTSIKTYVNALNTGSLGLDAGGTPIAVKSLFVKYKQGVHTKRSLVDTLQECAGDGSSAKCLPLWHFGYTEGVTDAFVERPSFNLTNVMLPATDSTSYIERHQAIVQDFNGDGRDDILSLGYDPDTNVTTSQLFISNGDGTFKTSTAFNITEPLIYNNGCYSTRIGDFNGDGLPDLLRVARPQWADSHGNYHDCNNALPSKIFMNKGDETFSPVAVVGPNLNYLSVVYQQTTDTTVDINTAFEFMVIDLNGDGIADIVQTKFPSVRGWKFAGGNANPCASQPCTQVFFGNGDGTFQQRPTNVANQSLLTVFNSLSSVLDIDGDGLPDLNLVTAFHMLDYQLARSNGDGNFTMIGPALNFQAAEAIDYKGDGRVSILNPDALSEGGRNSLWVADGPTGTLSKVTNFNLTVANTDVLSSSLYGANYGHTFIDFNGDGRADILRWSRSAGQTAIFTSNGDGTFTQSPTFALQNPAQSADLELGGNFSEDSYGSIYGDFLGNGDTQIIATHVYHGAGLHPSNVLWVAGGSGSGTSRPDLLTSVTSPFGVVDTVEYVAAGNSGTGASAVYTTDRGTTDRAVAPLLDTPTRQYLVWRRTSDEGGFQPVQTTYKYWGAKTDKNGRGSAGFRRFQVTGPGLNGNTHVDDTWYAQSFPYIGMPILERRTYSIGSATTQTTYCEQSIAPSVASNAISTSTSCPFTGTLAHPYALYTKTSGFDLGNVALPTHTVQQSINADGSPLSVTDITTMTGAASDTYKTITNNVYNVDDQSCAADNVSCKWILARVQTQAVERVVPNTIATTSAGTGAHATDVAGTGPSVFISLKAAPFGNVTVGVSATAVATLTNNSSTPQTVTVPTAASVTGTGFSFLSTTCTSTLAALGNCTITLRFAPTAAAAATGSLSFSTSQGQQTASLSGTGVAPTVTFVPQRANWGTVGIGSDSGDWPAITNTSTVPLLITGHTAVNGPAGAWAYQGDSGTCVVGTTTLQPGASCHTFFGMGQSTAVGSFSATDQISYQAVGVTGSTFTAQQPYTWSTAATTASVASLTFPNTTVNTTSAQQTFTVKNNATGSPVNISVSVVGPQPANFPTSNTCGSNLAAGASCTVTVSFNPTWIANGFSASVQIATTYPRMSSGAVEGYYFAAPASSVPLGGNGLGVVATLTSAASLTVPATWYGSAAQTVTATYRNDGNAPMTLATPTLAAPLSVTSNGCSSVAAGASCNMVVTAATNVPGLSQTQSFVPSGANTAPAATTVTWTTQTAVPRWSATSLAFGNVEDGTTASQNITLYNDGNTAYNWAARNSIANAPTNFTFNTSACASMTPGASCNVVVTFTPAGYASFAGSNVSMAEASYNTNTFSVSGTALYAPTLVASPSSFSGSSFTPAAVSTSIAISNTGMWPTTFTLSMTGGASVSPSTLSCPATGSCGSVTVTTPTAAGSYNGTLTGTSSAGGSVPSVPMTMSVLAAPSAFTVVSSTTNGTSNTTTFRNPNSVAVTPSSSGISLNNGGGFGSLTSNTCTGSIAANGTCTIVIYVPAPDCKDNNYTAHSYVTDAGGTVSGAIVSGSTTKTICN